MLKHINIVDTGADRYTLEIETNILGRMYDNNAETILVTKPESELEKIDPSFDSSMVKINFNAVL